MYFNGQVAQRYSVPTRLSMARGLNTGKVKTLIFVSAKMLWIVVIINIHTKIRIYLKK